MCAIEGADDGLVTLDVTLSPAQEEAFLTALVKDFEAIRACFDLCPATALRSCRIRVARALVSRRPQERVVAQTTPHGSLLPVADCVCPFLPCSQANVSAVDCRKATAFVPADEAMIKAAVEKTSFGFTGLNQAVIGRVSGWLAESGVRALKRLPEAERAMSSLQMAVADLFRVQGGCQIGSFRV